MQDVLKIKEQRPSFKKDEQHMCLYFKVYHSPKKWKQAYCKLFWDQHPNAFLIIEN